MEDNNEMENMQEKSGLDDRPLRILITDDSKLLRKKLRLELEKFGCEVLEAQNGKDAVMLTLQEKPDGVFLDIVMPEVGGIEALRVMKEVSPELPVIMLSSAGTPQKLMETLKLGALDFIQTQYEQSKDSGKQNERLKAEGLQYELKGRTKSINSIWQKMQKQGVDLSGIYDLFAIRIILDTSPKDEKRACWLAYSIVTDIYKANPSRFKDWISIPKSNGYESLHITVYGPGEKWVEVQIRSRRMDETAERGVAAHWRYKGIKSDGDADKWMNEVREMLEASGQEGQMSLMRNMDTNLYNDEVFVFTPKGDLIRLPQGATLLDFAYHIHTRVGSTCMGGKVDGKNQKINYRLKSGDTVEVITSATQSPRLDWLKIAVTSKARNKIKNAINERRAHQAQLARETLQRRFKNRKIEPDDATLARVIKKMGYKTTIEFYAAIQEDVIDVNDVVEQYESLTTKQNEATSRGTADEFVLQQPTANVARANDDILTIGDDVKGVNYKLAHCCNPIYGDRIEGFIASDGAIKIHRVDCKNLKHLKGRYPYRIIRTRWTGKAGSQFVASLKVLGRDDIGIVASITSVINKTDNCLLRSISIQSQGGLFEGVLTVNVSDITLLDELTKKILNVKGVKQVDRL